jgi:hypothetical protein
MQPGIGTLRVIPSIWGRECTVADEVTCIHNTDCFC